MPNVTPLRAEDPDRVGRYRLAGRISGMPGTGPGFPASSCGWPGSGVAAAARGLDAGPGRAGPVLGRGQLGGPPGAAVLRRPDRRRGFVRTAIVPGQRVRVRAIAAGDGPRRRPVPRPCSRPWPSAAATGLASVHQAGLVHGNFGPEHVVMSASGPRVIEYGITPPYGSATPSPTSCAWAQTMVFAATGPPAGHAGPGRPAGGRARRGVRAACPRDPARRPPARRQGAAQGALLGQGEPAAGRLAEGTRRAAGAGRGVIRPARPRAGGRGRPPRAACHAGRPASRRRRRLPGGHADGRGP